MKFTLKTALAALSLSAVALSTTPAAADPPPWAGHGKGHGRDDWKHGGKHDRYQRPGRVVYHYDWNRPDTRYGRHYRPDRYYRGGYEPIRVTRGTRIYRGYDDRYYCRRSDGTTGLIVGAALGGLLGGQLDRGYSNTAGVLIGAGAGALLGREIDRGNLNCR
ncbi:glycine zipper 2TM domain-containing protein [Sphingobium sp. JS3065]|uniref:glycine zipper 2TM domain-containing protein n=1 Tax=Sphingobium sp. JS3065 TaxID=2970925 RepID=UPI002264D87F|nr:glycine zipper 2TM domain-containing protein [Sphingobium sp. JS3065]UZW57266.1 glycine zipper 2TM domain-containing protein [Sphingobium sp. JS3065]